MTKKIGALDIGGTKISVGIVDEKGCVLQESSMMTILGEDGGSRSMESACRILERQCRNLGIRVSDLAGIGIVCTGPVDTRKGTVENPYTLPGWTQFPIVEQMKQRTGCEVQLENDANGMLMGEVLTGGLQKERVLLITFGTGIGVAFWDEKGLYCAGDGYHPEMGHIVVASYGNACYCQQTGCFEGLCSGTAWNQRARDLGFADFDSLFDAAKAGDALSCGLLEKIAAELKAGIWTLSLIFKPSVIILGGGMMDTYYPFIKSVLDKEPGMQTDFLNACTFLPAKKKNNSALAGISMMFQQP